MNLVLEPFNNFSKLATVVLLLLALSAAMAHNYTEQGKQVFSTKNKKNSHLIHQIVIYEHFMQHFWYVCTSIRSLQLFDSKNTLMKVSHVINLINHDPKNGQMICSSLSVYYE